MQLLEPFEVELPWRKPATCKHLDGSHCPKPMVIVGSIRGVRSVPSVLMAGDQGLARTSTEAFPTVQYQILSNSNDSVAVPRCT